jgi:sigma-B regulation protein RsbU (phosphoserine phosphatase)
MDLAEHRTTANGTEKLKTLLDFAKSLTQQIQLDKLPCAMIRELSAAMEAERSWVFLYEKQTGDLISKPVEGMDFPEIRIPHGVCAAGWAAEQRTTINIPDSFSDPRFDPRFEQIYGLLARSVLAVPMINQNQELIGVIEVINKRGGGPFTSEDEEILQAICTYLGLALERAQMIQAYLNTQKLQQSLQLALEIQMGLLPQKFPAFPGNPEIDICASVVPALEVGGDLYDFFMLDEDHIFFLIGDVSDKGVPAALFMAIVKTAFQIAAKGKVRMSKGGYHCVGTEEVPDIASVMRTVNNMLFENNPSQMFVTAFAGILDLRTGTIEYSDGGHEPPFIMRNNRQIEMLNKKGGVALGFLDDYVFPSGCIQLNPGDSLLLYTDGVNEARNIQNEMFARPAIGDTLCRISEMVSASIVVSTMLRRVQEFATGAPQSDDITLLAIQYRGRENTPALVA